MIKCTRCDGFDREAAKQTCGPENYRKDPVSDEEITNFLLIR